MATARCYTKSGSVEKYESECFSGGVNHYPHSFMHNIIGPDSNGNYTITYEGYDDGDSSNYDCYCETIYGDWRNGGGIKKTFYFKKKEGTVLTYNINCRIWVTGGNKSISICGDIESYDAQMPIPVHDLLRKDVIDTHIKVSIDASNLYTIDFELSSYTWNGYQTPHFKYTTAAMEINTTPSEYGIGNLNTKKKTITSKYNNCIYNVNYYIK